MIHPAVTYFESRETVTPSPTPKSGPRRTTSRSVAHLDTKRRSFHGTGKISEANLRMARLLASKTARQAIDPEGAEHTYQPRGLWHDQHPAGHPCTEQCADILVAMLGPEFLVGPVHFCLTAAQTYNAAMRARRRPTTTEEAIQ